MAKIDIIYGDPQPKQTFGSLDCGDLFMKEGSDTVYVATNSPINIEFNAIRLWDGQHAIFQNDEKVFKYIGRLIFNRSDFI